ncbi:protein Ecm25p [[Candida] anglica]
MERIFFKTGILDPSTSLPIYVFDTSYLPSTDLINYDAFIPTMMKYLPAEPYTLVMFNCGLNKISWVWGIKFLKQFLDGDDTESDNLSNLIKIYTVHDSWFVKSLTQIFNTKKNLSALQRMIDSFDLSSPFDNNPFDINSMKATKRRSKIVRCSNLSELSRHVELTKLKISLNIYKHNLQLEPEIQLYNHAPLLLNQDTTLYKLQNPLFYHHFYQIFNILDMYADKAELIFHKPGNKSNTDILFHCINRNQWIWINDWDLYCIAAVFKKILTDLPQPIIPLSCIQLPMKDDLQFTKDNFISIMQLHSKSNYDQLLYQLFDLCHKILSKPLTTKHTSNTLSKCLGHSLSHEVISSNKDRISVINRFVKNVMDNWNQLRTLYKYPTIDDIVNTSGEGAQKFNSYDISYDLTLDEDEDDLEYRVAFNTTNILSDDQNLKNHKKLSPPSTESYNLQVHAPSTSPRKVGPPVTPRKVHTKRAIPSSPKRKSPKKEHNPHSPTKSNHSTHTSSASTTTTPSTPVSPRKSSKYPSTSASPKRGKQSASPQKSSPHRNNSKLTDVSNILGQYPPQKYKFSRPEKPVNMPVTLEPAAPLSPVKKTVIRGRKVGELAKLFEERAQGLEVLQSMQRF